MTSQLLKLREEKASTACEHFSNSNESHMCLLYYIKPRKVVSRPQKWQGCVVSITDPTLHGYSMLVMRTPVGVRDGSKLEWVSEDSGTVECRGRIGGSQSLRG